MDAGSGSAATLSEAWAAFGRSDWEAARDGFVRVLESEPDPEALDGLGQALLWLGDEEGAIEARAKAFAGYRSRGANEEAASIAIYLAAEYRIAGNLSVSNGWLGRGRRLLERCGDCAGHGWLEIELAKRAASPHDAEEHARRAVEVARRIHDSGLEAAALSHLGLARVSQGDIAGGQELLDEALAIAIGGEAADPLSLGDTCCTTLVAGELLADPRRACDWAQAISEFMRRRRYLPLSPWCRSVYAGFLITTGNWTQAERELLAALEESSRLPTLRRTTAPPIYLADLRLRQGRLEEAERLLAGLEDHPAALAVAVALHLTRGEVDLAGERLDRRLEIAAGQPEAIMGSLYVLRGQVALARGDAPTAREAARAVAQVGERLGREDLLGHGAVLEARAAAVAGEPPDCASLELAVERFDGLGMVLEAAEARLELARAFAAARPQLAVQRARAALLAFERLGAARHADEAAGLLRELGVPGRPAPRSEGELTRREREVLALLAAGLSNREIAERLVISPRTAEHHVASILAKLGLANRAAAAAEAARRGIESGVSLRR